MKIKTLFGPGFLGDIVSIVIGALLTFAFAPCQLYLLAVILPAILYALWQHVTPKRAFLRGWLFGLGMFGAGVYWVFISIHVFGNASIFLAGFFTLAFIAILAIFPGLTGYFLNSFFSYSKRSRLFYAFPAIWVFLEWIRSWIFTGFPWLLIGYSQINSPLNGYAPIFGVYGLSLLVLFSSSLLVQMAIEAERKQFQNTLFYLVAFGLIWAIGAGLNLISWTHAFGNPIKVSLVQGNIPQEIKWSPDSVQTSLNTYKELSNPHWDSNIIIWPESAVPLPLQDASDFLNGIDEIAKKHQAAFITGVPVQVAGTQSYYNAVIALGTGQGYYLKRRLVPFGEYTPFHEWLDKFLDVLNIPMSDFIPSKSRPVPILADKIKIATFICYEIAFPEIVLSSDSSINLFLTVSNDAWFGHSIAQAQHLEMAQMRALENRRPILFVSNNGITAIINPNGKIKSFAPPYVPYVLTDTVQPTSGKTPWQYVGMDPILFLTLMLILLAIREQRIFKPRKPKNKLT